MSGDVVHPIMGVFRHEESLAGVPRPQEAIGYEFVKVKFFQTKTLSTRNGHCMDSGGEVLIKTDVSGILKNRSLEIITFLYL